MPAELDAGKVAAAVDAAFEPAEGLTAAFVVTWRGRIIGERYGDGITMHTPLEGWSMGKSLTATLMGVLIQRGIYDLYQAAPVPEWQDEGDPRAEIRIADIMHMSSGLRFRAPQDPDFDPSAGYPDHLYVYTGSVNSFEWAATRPQQWPPNTVGRYRNSDPVLTNYLIRLGVEGQGEEYLSFPQRDLFDKIGIRNMVLETDPYGNFLLQGYELGSARDWARLGNLYLQDGVWMGERILPAGYAEFVSTLAPRLGSRRAAGVRSVLLDQRNRRVPHPPRRLLHGRGRKPENHHHSVARPRRGSARTLQGRRSRRRGTDRRARFVDGSSTCKLKRLSACNRTSLTERITVARNIDTFFDVPTGRLKLRTFENGLGELIQYHRANTTGPTESRYVLAPTNEPEALKEALSNALGIRAVIRKRRVVHMVGRTRIHLDRVEGIAARGRSLMARVTAALRQLLGAAPTAMLVHR